MPTYAPTYGSLGSRTTDQIKSILQGANLLGTSPATTSFNRSIGPNAGGTLGPGAITEPGLAALANPAKGQATNFVSERTASPTAIQQGANPTGPVGIDPTGLAGQPGGGMLEGGGATPYTQGLNFLDSSLYEQNPDAYLMRVMQTNGMDPLGNSAGLFGAAEPYAPLINAMSLIANGTDPNFSRGEDLDWRGNEFASWMEPGTFYDPEAMLAQITGGGGAPGTGNPLNAYLTVGDPAGQVQNTMGLLKAATTLGMPTLAGRAMMDYYNRQGQAYLAQGTLTAGQTPFYQHMAGLGVGR